jgi:hypothetical protein
MADVFSQTGAFVNQTLASAFNPATSVYGADLYTGTNVDSLNVFEKAWMQWYMYWGNPVIATGIMSFLLHEVRKQKRGIVSSRSLELTLPSSLLADHLLWACYSLYDRRLDALDAQVQDPRGERIFLLLLESSLMPSARLSGQSRHT